MFFNSDLDASHKSTADLWKMQGFLKQYVSEKKPVAECGSSDEQAKRQSIFFSVLQVVSHGRI